jgi:hypothetical protein
MKFFMEVMTLKMTFSILLNLVPSTVPKWWKFILQSSAQLLNCLVDLDGSLYGFNGAEDYMDSILCSLNWWIWMTFCMGMMTLMMTSTQYYLIS